MRSSVFLNPSSRSVNIQTLLTGFHSFSYGSDWENLVNIAAIPIW